jgi:hypothetical protein
MTLEQIQEAMQFLRAATPEEIVFRTLVGECRGEPIEAQVGVGCVLRSRLKDARWPNTYNDVALQPAQFSCFNRQDPNLEKLMDPEEHEAMSVLGQLHWVARGIVADVLLDNVAGANHYYDFSVIVGPRSADVNKNLDRFTRLDRYLRAVDILLAHQGKLPPGLGHVEYSEMEAARDLIHSLVKDLPPRWDDEVLPVARKSRLVFFKL